MHQHRLNAILQRHRTRITSPTSPPQLQHNDTILETPEINIPPVLLNGRTDSRLQKLLNHTDDLLVLFVEAERVLLAAFLRMLARLGNGVDDRLAGRHGLRDETEHFRLDVCPVGVAGLGHGDEIAAVEDRCDAVDVQEVRGQWRGVRRSEGGSRREVLEEGGREVFGQNAVVGDEFQGLYIRVY